MSEIKNTIQEVLKTAMKAREQKKVITLRGLTAAIKQLEVDSRIEANDAQIIEIIQKEIKKRRDTIGFAEQQGRDEMVAENNLEIEILQQFLGAQLSEDELKGVIEKLVEGGAASIGQVMGSLNKDYKGQFEGRVASQITKELLS